jgi:hypothetical protein
LSCRATTTSFTAADGPARKDACKGVSQSGLIVNCLRVQRVERRRLRAIHTVSTLLRGTKSQNHISWARTRRQAHTESQRELRGRFFVRVCVSPAYIFARVCSVESLAGAPIWGLQRESGRRHKRQASTQHGLTRTSDQTCSTIKHTAQKQARRVLR